MGKLGKILAIGCGSIGVIGSLFIGCNAFSGGICYITLDEIEHNHGRTTSEKWAKEWLSEYQHPANLVTGGYGKRFAAQLYLEKNSP